MTDLIIGLSGYSRAGKDTAAQALVDQGWRRAGYADKLRDFLYALDPLIPGHYGAGTLRLRKLIDSAGWEYVKVTYPEVRALLQRAGTDAGRRVLGANVWVDALFREHEDAPALVVSDVRFPNEAQAVADRGGIVLRVDRPGVGPKRSRNGEVHESEVALDDWPFDHWLINDGTPADLHEKLRGITNLIVHKLHIAA
jgi:hypothetical protein